MQNSCAPRRLVRLAALFCVLSFVGATEGRGELMVYQYAGAITRADASAGVAAGAQFRGTFAFDLVAGPASRSEFTGGRSYEFGSISNSPGTASETGLDATVGGLSILQRWGVLTLNVYGPGAFGGGPGAPQTFLTVGASDSFGPGSISVQLTLLNTDRVVYPSLDVPARIDLADFTAARFEVVQDLGRGINRMLYEGVIDRLSAAATPSIIPEPSSLLLLGTAAGGYVLRARWRRRAADRPAG